MTTATTTVDVPTGSDALGSALEFGNVFGCRLRGTGDDVHVRDFETWLRDSILAATLSQNEDMACKGMGDLLFHYHDDQVSRDDRARRLRMVFFYASRYFVDPHQSGDEVQKLIGLLPTNARTRVTKLPPARRLKEISGLDVVQLAPLCGVSRVTYHQWMKGASPTGARLRTLLQVLSLMEEVATARSISDVGIWLQTPVEPNGPTPLDLLHERRYRAFIGFVHRRPIEERLLRSIAVRPSRASRKTEIHRSVEEIATTAWDEGDD